MLGVEMELMKNNHSYPRAQIIQNFFSIDETELHYKNYHNKRIPLIQCKDENGISFDEEIGNKSNLILFEYQKI